MRNCLECQWIDPHTYCIGSNSIDFGYYKTGLNDFLIYTVHSISKATVSTVAIFFMDIDLIQY
jgi:hypothetical protein